MFASRVLKSTVKYSLKRLSNSSGTDGDTVLSRVQSRHKKVKARNDWRSIWDRFKIETKLKFRQNKQGIFICLAFWFLGMTYYSQYEPFFPSAATSAASPPLPLTWNARWVLHVTLTSLAIRSPSPESQGDFSKFYELCWPIFVEVVVFGLVATSMLGHYNPVVVCRLTAEELSNHTVVIGYEHLGERLVEHLRDTQAPYCLIDEQLDRVSDLVKIIEPVVVGSPSDISTLEEARVGTCKEVFVAVNLLHQAIVACFNIRTLNKTCKVYVQIFEHEEFKDYFAKAPLSSYTFSTSKWAIASIMDWIEDDLSKEIELEEKKKNAGGAKGARLRPSILERRESVILPPGYCAPKADPFTVPRRRLSSSNFDLLTKLGSKAQTAPGPSTLLGGTGEILVIGSSNLARRIVKSVSSVRNRMVHWADQSEPGFMAESDPAERRLTLEMDPASSSRVKVIQLPSDKMLTIEQFVPFERVSHTFVCWNRESRFSDTVFLTMMISQKFPKVKTYVQTSDETLADILTGLGATPFSTSKYAFSKLQGEVSSDSGLASPRKSSSSDLSAEVTGQHKD